MHKIKKILLIDDDELFNIIHKEVLKGVAEEVEFFINGKEAISHLEMLKETEFPDLIFLDIDMPVMNGFEFLKEFCEKYDEALDRTKIYMLTSSYLQKDMGKAHEFNISAYILKPLTKAKLVEALKKF